MLGVGVGGSYSIGEIWLDKALAQLWPRRVTGAGLVDHVVKVERGEGDDLSSRLCLDM